MEDIENINKLINKHLDLNTVVKTWRIDKSPLGGRGIFANRDIEPGEIIFIDQPLVLGPRAKKNVKFYCVSCYNLQFIRACSNGCGLPLCSIKCEQSETHLKECAFIVKLNKNKRSFEISSEIFRGLVPLRLLLLCGNSSFLLNCFFFHKGKYHSFEIELLKSKLNLSEIDENNLKLICSVLDTNVYEIIVQKNNLQISLRGMYSIASMLNHSCVPNTMHCYNHKQQMIVKSTVAIKKDSEIFTSYTSSLWGTTSRRHHLAATKYFWCQCDRCKDPKEFGSALSGLKCISKKCDGVLYPVNPLIVTSQWQCALCEIIISSKKIGVIQSCLGGLLKTMDVSDLGRIILFLKDRLGNFVPLKNQIAIEIKCKIIWVLGNTENYYWNDIADEQLIFKEKLCREILQLLMDVGMGQSLMRGHILYELYRCCKEKSLRISLTQTLQDITDFETEGRKYLQDAVEILKDDVAAPKEIKNIVEHGSLSARQPAWKHIFPG